MKEHFIRFKNIYWFEQCERGRSLITVICLTCQLIIDSSQPIAGLSKGISESEGFKIYDVLAFSRYHFSDKRTLKRSIAYRSAVSGSTATPATAGSIETGPWRLRFRRPSRVHSRGRSVTEKSACNRINSPPQSSRSWMHRNGLFMSQKLAFIISIIDQVSSRTDESIRSLPFSRNGKHLPFIFYPLFCQKHLLHFCHVILRTQWAPCPENLKVNYL